MDDELVYRDGTILVFVNSDSCVGIQDALSDEALLKKVRHARIHVVPFGNFHGTEIACIVRVFFDPVPGPAGDRVNVVYVDRDLMLAEALP